MGSGQTWSNVLSKGREKKGKEHDTCFVASLSLGGDMSGHFGVAGPGFLVKALRWV